MCFWVGFLAVAVCFFTTPQSASQTAPLTQGSLYGRAAHKGGKWWGIFVCHLPEGELPKGQEKPAWAVAQGEPLGENGAFGEFPLIARKGDREFLMEGYRKTKTEQTECLLG